MKPQKIAENAKKLWHTVSDSASRFDIPSVLLTAIEP